jgi:hypothetical protein
MYAKINILFTYFVITHLDFQNYLKKDHVGKIKFNINNLYLLRNIFKFPVANHKTIKQACGRRMQGSGANFEENTAQQPQLDLRLS